MRTIEITVGDSTYHVDVAALSGRPLKVTIDGQPLEVQIGSVAETKGNPALTPAMNPSIMKKPVMAEWHASLRAE